MSQSAIFYRLEKDDFSCLQKDKDFNWYSRQKGYVTVSGTHEGLRFIIAKDRDAESIRLVDELFYPIAYIETEDEFWDDAPSERAIHYHDLLAVKNIKQFLSQITEEAISFAFDPAELNKNNIYPCAWHNDPSTLYAFNENDLLRSFAAIKAFFEATDCERQYVVVLVG